MRLTELGTRLDERLRVDAFAAIDASPNGWQVAPSDKPVERVAFAVDAVAETIDAADAAGADALCTHHGLVWGGLDRITGRTHDRLARLLAADLALYVVHLPLDAHQTLGNAAGLANRLDLGDRAPFGKLDGPEPLGQRGTLPTPTPADELADQLGDELDVGDGTVRVIEGGPPELVDIAILTGAGADAVDEAADAGADALLTGEVKGRTYHEAHEAALTVIAAGHYATETFGVRSLRSMVADWGLKTTFLDCPTGF